MGDQRSNFSLKLYIYIVRKHKKNYQHLVFRNNQKRKILFYVRNTAYGSNDLITSNLRGRLEIINPLTPRSDKQDISPDNYHTLSSKQVMRTLRLIRLKL